MGEERLCVVRYCSLLLPHCSCLHLVAQLWHCQHDSTYEQLGPWTLHRWNMVTFSESFRHL